MNLRTELEKAEKTGKVVLGAKNVRHAFLNGNPKLVLISKNCPNEIFDEFLYYGKLSNVPCLVLDKNSEELGALCGRPFSVSSLCILDEGESSILEIVKKHGKNKT